VAIRWWLLAEVEFRTYVDILAGRTQVRNVVNVQQRICIRCVTYDVKAPWDGCYISG